MQHTLDDLLPVPTATELPPERVLQMLCIEQLTPKGPMKHSHYFKPTRGLEYIDIYRVLALYNITDPCISHAIKKLLVPGGRGAGKDVSKDVQEAIDSLERWKAMQEENARMAGPKPAPTPMPWEEPVPMAPKMPQLMAIPPARPSGFPAPSSLNTD